MDLASFFAPITKWSATVHRADRLAEFVDKGLRIATSSRPGPVMLAVPADLLGEEVHAPPQAPAEDPPRPAPGGAETMALARRLSEARTPVVIAGAGAGDARQELISFAETYDIGVYAAFRRQDVFPNEHPLYLGHLTLGTPPETLRALEAADLIFVVGSRLDEVTTQSYVLPRPDQAVIRVDPDPAELAATVPAGHRVVADARAALSALVAQAPSRGPARDWTEAHRAFLDSSTVPATRSEGGIDPSQVIAALREVVPEDSIMTNDAGNFSAFLHRYWRYNHPHTQLAAANGAMGYGVPSAVAAKLAAPERPVVACCGDGGFFMTGQELETAVRYGTSILVVVFAKPDARHDRDAPGAGGGTHRRRRDRRGGPGRLRPEPGRRRLLRARPRRPRAYTRRGTRLRRRRPRGRGDRPGRHQPFSPSLRTGSGQEPLHTWLRASWARPGAHYRVIGRGMAVEWAPVGADHTWRAPSAGNVGANVR